MIEAQQKPLLVRMPNWIGDCMMALPTLHYLEKKGFDLTLVGKPWLHNLFADNWPVIEFSKQDKSCIEALKQHPANEILLLTNSFSSAQMAKKAKKKAIGYKGNLRNLLLHKKFTAYANLHESNHFLKLAQLYLKDVLNKEPLKAYSLPNKATKHIQNLKNNLLEKHPVLNKPFILICPFAIGANKAGHSKLWPYWQELIEEFQQKFPEMAIVYCPGKDESFESDNVVALDNIKLDAYFAVMALAKTVIGNDTGPMHMASCVNPNTLTIFGATDPERTAPINGVVAGRHGEWPSTEDVLGLLKI